MTLPTPIVALEWESAIGEVVDLQADPTGIRVFMAEGLDQLPVVRTSEDVIPFQPGRLRSASVADRRAIVLQGYVSTPDNETYRGIIARLQRAMDPTVGAGTLTATLEAGGTRTIEAVPRNIVYEGHLRTGKHLSIELDADPFWRGPEWGESWTADSGLFADDGLTADMGTGPITIEPGGDTSVAETFPTLGTTATLDAVIEVDGPSTSSIAVYNADGVGFTYPTLSSGQTLVVDAGARTALIASTSVRANLALRAANRRGEWFRIRPRTDTVTVTGAPAEVRITFRPTYL